MTVMDTQQQPTPSREAEIRRMVREAIVCHLEQELTGDELLTKEVWEEIFDKNESAILWNELEAIISLIKARFQ